MGVLFTSTRRALLLHAGASSFSASYAARRGETIPNSRVRVVDPLTDNDMIRLTDPASANWLPRGTFIAGRNNTLLLCSEHDSPGKPQLWRMELRSGQSKVLTDASALDRSSPSLTPDERWVLYADGNRVWQMASGGGRERELYAASGGIEPVGIAVTIDGLYAYVVEQEGAVWKLIQIPLLTRTTPSVLAESPVRIGRVLPRPKRASLAYERGGEWWMVNQDGKQNRKLPAEGGALPAGFWSPDGAVLSYLVAGGAIRECEPDTNKDRSWTKSSGMVEVARNGDGSVLAGMSGSIASPYVLLTLRVTKRERPMVAHRASTPGRTSIVFSPNSQRIFFESDFQGKAAVYMLAVDRLVEKIEAEGTA